MECFQYQQTVTNTVKTFLATWKPAGGVIRVVLVKEDNDWLPYFSTDPEASVKDILEAAAGRTSLEQVFKDVKEDGGRPAAVALLAGQRGEFNFCLWSYAAVEWWAWDEPFERLCDREDSPWDDAERRPSHADRRKALQQKCLEEEFWRRWGDRPCPPEIREIVQAVLRRAG